MKKLFVSLLITAITILTVTTAAHSTTYVFQPSYPSLTNLYHRYYYTWGIDLISPLDGQIVSASIFVDGIYNLYPYGYPNDLWVHLLDGTTSKVGLDCQTGDYFSGQGELIFHGHGLPSRPLSIDYDFSMEEIGILNDYALDLNFGFGFDPDCYFKNRGITLTLVTAQVPEPSTWMLLAIGSFCVACVEITRLIRYIRKSGQESESCLTR